MSINSRVQDVIQLLKQSKSPLLIGIWGMAGIGKTTIAQAIYHQIGPYFADKCFLKKRQGSLGTRKWSSFFTTETYF
ncbi:putative P-loop containing nucleoside triphosphate hydrolase [Medicago truncatula]|uniref:Putative P-loop containing nucleoside triphosphate hydrolase n=1 Tax=Medicago truncatula TaxID=3880 RepID=A0A396I0B1_MEDTR|nr:putative P-loop containing nucleoside triphosphate hydrolase [Medicago truncatula]